MLDFKGEKLCVIKDVPRLRTTFLAAQRLLDEARADFEAAKKRVDAAHHYKWGRIFDVLVAEGILPDGAGSATWSLQWGDADDGFDPNDMNAATVLYGRRKTDDDKKGADGPAKMIDDAIRKIALGGVSQ